MNAFAFQGEPDAQSAIEPRRRGLIAFACFALGLVLALHLPALPAMLWLGLGAGLCAAALLLHARLCAVMLALAAIAAGAGALAVRLQGPMPATPAAVSPVLVQGIVLDPPRPLAGSLPNAGTAATRFDLLVRSFQSETSQFGADGILSVTVAGATPDITAGDRIACRGFLIPIEAPRNPGEPDQRPRAAQDGRLGRLSVESADLLTPWLQSPSPTERLFSAWRRVLGSLRTSASDILDSALGPRALEDTVPARSLLGALLLGRTDPALRPLSAAMARLGQVHVLSISGFHIAVMAGMALFVIRLTGDRGALEPLLAAALIILYLLVVPAETPVLRSGFMALALLLAESTGRRYDRLNLLGWVAIALLAWRPLDLWSAGFQLSFGVTAALLWLAPRVHARWFPPPVVGRTGEAEAARDPGLRPFARVARSWVTALLSSSVLCWAVAAPAIMHHVGIVSPLAALTSVVLVPIFTLALWLGFGVLLVGALWPAAAGALGWLLALAGDAAAGASLWLDGFPFMVVTTPRVPALWAIAATALIAAWFRWGRRDDARLWTASALVLAWLVIILARSGALPPATAGRLDALAVGDGHAILIRSGPHAVLWGASARSPGEIIRAVPRAAAALGCWRVRTLVIPGGAPEDFAAAPEIAQSLAIADALVSAGLVELAREDPAGPAADLLRRLAAARVAVRPLSPGQELRFAHATLRVLDHAGDGAASHSGILAGQVEIARTDGPPASFLLAGHLRPPQFTQLLARLPSWRGDAVELPAAAGKDVEPWLAATGARLAWVSDAPRLASPADPKRASTARDGAIAIEIPFAGEPRVTSHRPRAARP